MQIFSGENKYIEYKQEYSSTLLKTICAFSNFHDGYIVIGIKALGEIVGINDIEENKLKIENAVNDTIVPKPYYEFIKQEFDNKEILIIKVYKGDFTPYLYKDQAYMRLNTSTVKVDKTTHQNLILEGRNLGYEDLTSEFQDLEFSILEKMMKRQLSINSLTNDLLRTLGLLVSGKFNNAAGLLSDYNPVSSSKIQLISFADNTVKHIKDKQIISKTSLLKQFDMCMDFYKKHINVHEIINGAYRKTIEEVPIVAYREAVSNMLVHRDYSIMSDSRIEIFADRIEIVSPGGLPIGLFEEEYIEGRISIARNKKIADIFLRLKIIEKLATGIRRIKLYYKDYEVCPEFFIYPNVITVVLPRIKVSYN